MDIKARIHLLELRYRQAISSAVVAKANYLALLDAPGSAAASVRRARLHWQTLDTRKREIAARLGETQDYVTE